MSTKELIAKYKRDARLAAQRFKTSHSYEKLFKPGENRDGKPEDTKNTTFLYIRATLDDSGQRPLSTGTEYWNSPDVEISDLLGNNIASNQMKALQQYNITVVVNNGGDMVCNSCTVELYICNPAIGFTLANAVLIGRQTISINGHGNGSSLFKYIPSSQDIGHRCLFARAYSFTSLDMPINSAIFDTSNDRHTGQQNTNIVQEAELYTFNISGKFKPTELFQLEIRTMDPSLFKVKYSSLKGFVVVKKEIIGNIELKRVEPVKPVRGTGPSTLATSASVLHNLAPVSTHLWEMSFSKSSNKLQLKIPNLKLARNQASILIIELTSNKRKKSYGGLTLLVRK